MATDDTGSEDVPDEIVRDLYGVAPADFLARRTAAVKRLRGDGEADLARQVTGLRKPTLSASIVNRLVHADASVVPRLAELGDSMRAAQDDLDVPLLRELSEARRRLVNELVAAAVDEIGENPSPAVQDEVGATFEAAVADPDVLAVLGRLVRPQRWSGFGLPAASGPTLTLVAGTGRRDADQRTGAPAPKPTSKSTTKKTKTKAGEAEPDAEAETTTSPPPPRRTARMLARAQSTFDDAEAALTGADDAEAAARDQVSELSDRLAEVTAQLEKARRDHEAARREARAARTRRREARSALDRALRNAGS